MSEQNDDLKTLVITMEDIRIDLRTITYHLVQMRRDLRGFQRSMEQFGHNLGSAVSSYAAQESGCSRFFED